MFFLFLQKKDDLDLEHLKELCLTQLELLPKRKLIKLLDLELDGKQADIQNLSMFNMFNTVYSVSLTLLDVCLIFRFLNNLAFLDCEVRLDTIPMDSYRWLIRL